MHWADRVAAEVVAGKKKDEYICASGITPSGTIHFGNFREIISVDMVLRALRHRGAQARFLYFWDDYDTFRKVPSTLPDSYRQYLRRPLDRIPAPEGTQSYAEYHEKRLEACLPVLGIEPDYIRQSERYRSSSYASYIRSVMNHRDRIREILNQFRSSQLAEDWWPVSVYSSFTQKDSTTVVSWDGEWTLQYRCEETGHTEALDIRRSGQVKLLWRVDWPMRWTCYTVDFEPAGKDHHSDGGSFDTAELLVRRVFDAEPPVSFQYDFVGIKGRGGKMSSSSGSLVALDEVMEIYQPEVVRYLFASTRPNSEFVVSFDVDVIKIYEDYDRCERIVFGVDDASDERRQKEQRIYELSQVATIPRTMPLQLPFRHLCNVVQITGGDVDAALEKLAPHKEHTQTMRVRAEAAWRWVQHYAPEEYRFVLRDPSSLLPALSEQQLAAVKAFYFAVSDENFDFRKESLDEAFHDAVSEIAPRELYEACYLVLIGKKRGPRLVPFMCYLGRTQVLSRFQGPSQR